MANIEKRLKVILSLAIAVMGGFIPSFCAPQIVKQDRIPPNVLDINTGLENLASRISGSMQEKKKTGIAILDFTDLQGNVSDLGRFIAEKLIITLFETKKFNIIERSKLNKIFEEQKFQVSALVDEETAKRIGRIVGVDAIVIGTITDLGEQVDINARLLSVETGSVFAVASVKFEKDETVRNLITKGNGKSVGETLGAKEETTQNIVEKAPYTFRLKDCKLSMDEIVCQIFITLNDDEERNCRINLYDKTSLYGNISYILTDSDTQYPLTNCKGATVTYCSIYTPPRLPTLVQITFKLKGEMPKILKILTLRGDCGNYSGTSFFVNFKDVGIQ